jgi:hypothetical protein
MNDLKIRAFVMDSGERYSLLVDRLTGLPVYAPNLFLTTQVRNASLSHAALAAYLLCWLSSLQVRLRDGLLQSPATLIESIRL